MKYVMVSPRLAIQKGDFLGSGVPYWPVELAILASFLRDRGHDVEVVDLFGSDPRRLTDAGSYYWQGEQLESFLPDLPREEVRYIVYAISYMSHPEILDIVRKLRTHVSGDAPNGGDTESRATVWVLENSQAVTGYALSELKEEFLEAGADAVLIGEVYTNWDALEAGNFPETRAYTKLEKYPPPAWDLFELKNYWSLPYSHGPKSKTYLPILTSRGCPYPCNFCVVPATNERKWRGRNPEDVADEMIFLRDKFGVHHFQVEDLNPTVQVNRWTAISLALIRKKAEVFYYFVSGTKAETVKIDDVPTLARGGCRYISISPESGSEGVMKAIGKPFDYEHGLKLVQACDENGIYTQACFLVGHPAETEEDHKKSCTYLRKLIRAGLDEAAIFVVSPYAGSQLFKKDAIKLKGSENLISFSPKGREDWQTVERRRSELIRIFFVEKLRHGPEIFKQGLRSLFGQPRTKMENLPKRMLYVTGLMMRARFSPHEPLSESRADFPGADA